MRFRGLVYPNVYPKNCDVFENEYWRGLRSIFRSSPRPPYSMRPSALSGSGAFLQLRLVFYNFYVLEINLSKKGRA